MPYAAALSPRTSLRVRNTEDEDSPERATAVRSPRPVGERAAERCSQTMAVDQGFFDSLIVTSEEIQERRFLYGMKFGQMTAKGMAVRAALIVCPAGSPLPVTVYANFAVKARDKGCGFHGYLASFGASAGAYPLPR